MAAVAVAVAWLAWAAWVRRATDEALFTLARLNLEKKTFHANCVEYAPAITDVNAVSPEMLNVWSRAQATCSGHQVPDYIATGRPFFVLGEPGTGKRFALLQMQARLLGDGVPSLFVTVKECRKDEKDAVDLVECVSAALERALNEHSRLPKWAHRRAADAFLARQDGWLLLDALDDVGDPIRIVSVTGGVLDLLKKRHGSRIAVSAKGEHLAHAAFLVPSTTHIREAFTRFDRVYVLGLNAEGERSMTEQLIAQAPEQKRPELERRLAVLRELAACGGAVGELASDILRRPGLLRLVLRDTRDEARRLPVRSTCDADAHRQLAEWSFHELFTSYCNDICGKTGNVSSQIRLATERVLAEFRARPLEEVNTTLLNRVLTQSAGLEAVGIDDLARAISGSGLVTITGADLFQVRGARIGPVVSEMPKATRDAPMVNEPPGVTP